MEPEADLPLTSIVEHHVARLYNGSSRSIATFLFLPQTRSAWCRLLPPKRVSGFDLWPYRFGQSQEQMPGSYSSLADPGMKHRRTQVFQRKGGSLTTLPNQIPYKDQSVLRCSYRSIWLRRTHNAVHQH